MSIGVTSADFDQIYNDLAVATSYSVVTKTTDAITGSETSTFAAASTIYGVFLKEDNKYIWDKEGLVKVGDAYIMFKTSVGAKRYDQLTYNGSTYYIEQVTRRELGGNAMADYCTLFLVT